PPALNAKVSRPPLPLAPGPLATARRSKQLVTLCRSLVVYPYHLHELIYPITVFALSVTVRLSAIYANSIDLEISLDQRQMLDPVERLSSVIDNIARGDGAIV
ncbi:unnamed protein product, partial [Rhizoctonia solani]